MEEGAAVKSAGENKSAAEAMRFDKAMSGRWRARARKRAGKRALYERKSVRHSDEYCLAPEARLLRA